MPSPLFCSFPNVTGDAPARAESDVSWRLRLKLAAKAKVWEHLFDATNPGDSAGAGLHELVHIPLDQGIQKVAPVIKRPYAARAELARSDGMQATGGPDLGQQ